MTQQNPYQNTDLPPLPQPQVPWFNLEAVDMFTLQAHMMALPAMQAYIQEQYSAAEKAYRDANDRAEEMKGRAFAKARSEPHDRLSKKGGYDQIDASDDLARYLAYQDPDYLQACEDANHARYVRDIWYGYNKALDAKKQMLLTLGGLLRAEMEMQRNVQ